MPEVWAEDVAQRHVGIADVPEVVPHGVGQVEHPGVAGLHHQDRREGLGDRADAVLPVQAGRHAGTARPHRAVAVEHGSDHRRQPALGLRDVEQPLPLVAHSANASGGGQAHTRLRSP